MFKKLGLICSLMLSVVLATPAVAADGDHTVYMLRHAEKISGQYDGDLTGVTKNTNCSHPQGTSMTVSVILNMAPSSITKQFVAQGLLLLLIPAQNASIE
jgi:hypothetical protein